MWCFPARQAVRSFLIVWLAVAGILRSATAFLLDWILNLSLKGIRVICCEILLRGSL